MKSVLIAIRPQWVEKIASGQKTIEVRKTAPQEVPFKASGKSKQAIITTATIRTTILSK